MNNNSLKPRDVQVIVFKKDEKRSFKAGKATAIQRGAMETETISKNVAIPKSLMSRENI
jgi:hypothetical protein